RALGSDPYFAQYLTGQIDNIRIYNPALTPTAIQTDMTAPIGTTGGGTDTTPPSTPAGLATSGIGQTSATLSWSPSTDNVGVTGYRVYLNGGLVTTALTTSYLYSGLSCGTGYTLGVAAVDAAGNTSTTATTGLQT